MTTSVSVFGLGYVGCVSAACFAKQGHNVIGVDVNPVKVDLINRGESTIVESGIGELVTEMVAAGRLRATTDSTEAIRASAISLVCVGTPSLPNGGIDLTSLTRVCQDIGQALHAHPNPHIVVIRSTVLPGTIHELVIPTLEAASGLRVPEELGVCTNPEFLREGTSIEDFYAPPFTLIGTDDPRATEQVAGLYEGIEAPLHVAPIGVAEMVKYACNAFHALKIGFANEIGNVSKALGIDSHEVMRLVCEDKKLNISCRYLKPGFAFGGSCLPKDIRALSHRATSVDVDMPILRAVLDGNKSQITRAFNMVMATKKKRIGVLGLSFKAGTDDLRESPMVALIELLIGKGLQLSIYDRDVSEARLVGANREFIEREIPHIWSLMKPTTAEVLAEADVVVIGNSTAEIRTIATGLREGQMVIDLDRSFDGRHSGPMYQGICW
jgi:GDP-mannose 6-dehydrogenase